MQVVEFRTIGFMDMMAEITKLIDSACFEAGPDESPEVLQERLRRTLDKAPPLYAFLSAGESYLAYWTDMAANMDGTTSQRYKDLKNKRDTCERLGRAVKLFYESASRRITLLIDVQEYQNRR